MINFTLKNNPALVSLAVLASLSCSTSLLAMDYEQMKIDGIGSIRSQKDSQKEKQTPKNTLSDSGPEGSTQNSLSTDTFALPPKKRKPEDGSGDSANPKRQRVADESGAKSESQKPSNSNTSASQKRKREDDSRDPQRSHASTGKEKQSPQETSFEQHKRPQTRSVAREENKQQETLSKNYDVSSPQGNSNRVLTIDLVNAKGPKTSHTPGSQDRDREKTSDRRNSNRAGNSSTPERSHSSSYSPRSGSHSNSQSTRDKDRGRSSGASEGDLRNILNAQNKPQQSTSGAQNTSQQKTLDRHEVVQFTPFKRQQKEDPRENHLAHLSLQTTPSVNETSQSLMDIDTTEDSDHSCHKQLQQLLRSEESEVVKNPDQNTSSANETAQTPMDIDTTDISSSHPINASVAETGQTLMENQEKFTVANLVTSGEYAVFQKTTPLQEIASSPESIVPPVSTASFLLQSVVDNPLQQNNQQTYVMRQTLPFGQPSQSDQTAPIKIFTQNSRMLRIQELQRETEQLMQEQIKELENAIEKKNLEYENAVKDNKQTAAELQRLKEANHSVQDTLTAKEGGLSDLTGKYNTLTETHNTLTVKHNMLTEEHNTLTVKYNTLTRDYARCQSLFGESHQKVKLLTDQNRELETKRKSIEEESLALQDKLKVEKLGAESRYQKALLVWNNQYTELGKKKDEAEEKARDLETQRAQISEELQNEKLFGMGCVSKITSLTNELSVLKQQAGQHQPAQHQPAQHQPAQQQAGQHQPGQHQAGQQQMLLAQQYHHQQQQMLLAQPRLAQHQRIVALPTQLPLTTQLPSQPSQSK